VTTPTHATIDYGARGEVWIVPDGGALAIEAATLLLDVLVETRGRRGAIALSGGSTPKQMGKLLAEPAARALITGSTAHFFWGDERWVPLTDPESNAGEALRGWLEPAGVGRDRVHPYRVDRITPEESADLYAEWLAPWAANDNSLPVLDLVFLGMGGDGHTLSLFPGTAAVQERQRWVVANHVPKLNTVRLTMTAPVINAARKVVFLAGGASKAARLASVLDGPIDVDLQPSQIIRPINGGPIWMIDEAAAANLAKLPEAKRG
jgi:6-phosphogluconolactonase